MKKQVQRGEPDRSGYDQRQDPCISRLKSGARGISALKAGSDIQSASRMSICANCLARVKTSSRPCRPFSMLLYQRDGIQEVPCNAPTRAPAIAPIVSVSPPKSTARTMHFSGVLQYRKKAQRVGRNSLRREDAVANSSNHVYVIVPVPQSLSKDLEPRYHHLRAAFRRQGLKHSVWIEGVRARSCGNRHGLGLHQRPVDGLGMHMRAKQRILDGLLQDFVRGEPVGKTHRRDPHGATIAEGALGELQAARAPVVAAVAEQSQDALRSSTVAPPRLVELGVLPGDVSGIHPATFD